MQRRSLDALFSAGFLVAAALLVAVGIIMSGNASYTNSYINHQLEAQRISFPPKDVLTTQELARPCVVANAGKYVVNASQARCYADEFLGVRIDALVEQGTPKEQLFRGETQRGLLLTSSMFDAIGHRSRALGSIFYIAAAMMALVGIATSVHRKTVTAISPSADTLGADAFYTDRSDSRGQSGLPGAGRPDPVQRRVLHRRQRVGHSARR